MSRLRRQKRRCFSGLWWSLAAALAAGCFIRRQMKREKEEEVFITEAGTKYHREDCIHLKGSRTAVPRSKAEEEGYQPCGVCQP